MKNKLIYLILIIIFVSSPLFASADGGAIRILPDGDWTWADENSQNAFINHQNEIEKLIVVVDIDEQNSDTVWVIPIPGRQEEVEIDVVSGMPIFSGDEVMSKAKLALSDSVKTSFYISVAGQIWPFPFSILTLVSLGGARGGGGEKGISGDLISVGKHIEKKGMVVEVITAKEGRALYNYLSNKGVKIEEGSISALNSYIEKDYVFVVSWLSPSKEDRSNEKQRGIFITFPTQKIYYPLIPTSVYGEKEIPITIRVLGHVKPDIFSEIRSFAEVDYFTERTSQWLNPRCQAGMAQFRTIFEIYYSEHNSYPASLEDLKNDPSLGNDASVLIEDMKKRCPHSPIYYRKNSDEYEMAMLYSEDKVWMIDSSGRSGQENISETMLSPASEFAKFFENKKLGDFEYTKITINAPAQLLKKDLWMEEGRPLKVSLALWVADNPLISTIFIYLLFTLILSFLAGGIAGLIYYHNFKKYALIGLANVFTLLGFILVLRLKRELKSGFVLTFSLIFLFLLAILSFAFLWGDILASLLIFGLLGLLFVVILPWYLIRFIFNKLGFKGDLIKVIILIIFWILIFWLLFILL